MSVIYSTPASVIGRHEWRIEVRSPESFGERPSVIPVWRKVGTTRWMFPSEFCGEWPKGLFSLACEHLEALGDAVSRRVVS